MAGGRAETKIYNTLQHGVLYHLGIFMISILEHIMNDFNPGLMYGLSRKDAVSIRLWETESITYVLKEKNTTSHTCEISSCLIHASPSSPSSPRSRVSWDSGVNTWGIMDNVWAVAGWQPVKLAPYIDQIRPGGERDHQHGKPSTVCQLSTSQIP